MAERVLAELAVLVPGGVEEERGSTYVEYAIYGEPGEVPSLPALEAAAGEGLVEIETTEVPDDWGDRWRDFHKPVEVAGRLLVRPDWADVAAGADQDARERLEVVINPGQAFGTGSHATTRMCLELLVALADDGGAIGSLVDLGTGSGVLGIAAAKLGWEPVEGCDHEVAAIEAARENAAANGVRMSLRRINLREDDPPVAATVVANLTAGLLDRVAQRLEKRPAGVPERLICSGLLASELDSIADAFEAAGLGERRRLSVGEWAALLLARE